MLHRLPAPDELFDDLCTLLSFRYRTFTGNGRNEQWTNLLKGYFRALAASLGMMVENSDLVADDKRGNALEALRFVDTNDVAVEVAWQWRHWDASLVEVLLRRPACLKVFLTDPAKGEVAARRRSIAGLIGQALANGTDGDVLVVIASAADGRRSPHMCKAAKIVAGSSVAHIPRGHQ